MKAVVLAAGKGTRLQPLTTNRSKVMVPIGNKPLLEQVISIAKKAGITEFIFVISAFKNQIQEYFKDGAAWNVSIEYVDQQKPLGTAHAIKVVEKQISNRFLVLSGDTLVSSEDITLLSKKKTTTIGITSVDNPSEYGVVETNKTNLISLHEKTANPPSKLINTGMYLLDNSIFDAIDQTKPSKRKEYEITDSFNWMIKQDQNIKTQAIDTWVDMSRPWDVLKANKYVLQQMKTSNIQGNIDDHVTIKKPVNIGENTVVLAGSYIEGPVHIGENCEIGPNCYIRPFTSIGDGCHIGNATEIKNTVLFENSNCPHQNYVGDSVIGSGCNLGAGTKIANLRLDKKQIKVTLRQKKLQTKCQKLGCIMGDEVQTGINAQINPGTIIGSYSFIGPGSLASGTILEKSHIM